MLGNFKKLLRGVWAGSPTIVSHPQSVYDVVPGSTLTLLVMVDAKQQSSSELQFEWQYCTGSCSKQSGSPASWVTVEPGENKRICGHNTSTLVVTELRQADAGSYRCLVTNSSGVTQSRPATLTVVVPPQIESHPVDVLDAITGTEATFSISMCPLQQQTANGGVKSNRGQGQEGLQFGWEVLRAQSATKSTAANGSGVLHSPLPDDKTPESPHQRIFREHHPDLRHYLNTSSILPYLSKHSLVTADQLEELTLPVLTNTRKVDLLLNWLPRSTVDFLEKFIVCLREASDHLAHAELAGKLEEAVEGDRARSGSQVSEASLPVSPLAAVPSLSEETGGAGRGWVDVREEEGRVEGTATVNLQLLHVEKLQEGQYRCRVVYKGCTVFSQPASLTVMVDDVIIGRLLHECLDVEETAGHAIVADFLGKYGNSSRLAKKALISVLQCETELPNLIQSFTSRQVPVNFIQDGMTPLHWACVGGHWRIVQHLLVCGACKTALTQEGRNSVHLVCERGDNNSLQFLIHTGAEGLVNVQDKYGKTPLHLACEAAKKITPSKFISQDMRDIKTVIQNLLKHHSSLRTTDENGHTPLHLAAMAGHPWIVEVFLLCDTAGINDQDKSLNTPLHLASSLDWGEVVISLLERGANESMENQDHMTPLALAEVKGYTGVADILKGKPGTVKRDRKQTVYVTDKLPRPRSVNLGYDGTSPVQSSPLLKASSIEQSRSGSQLSHDSKVLSSTGLLKLFHHHNHEKKECAGQQEDALMSGYVQKMEGKKWVKLWCQLQVDCTLHLYKTQDSSASTSLPLLGYKVEPVTSTLTISLVHPKGKSKYNSVFKLDNQPEFTQWVQVLEKAVGGEGLPPLVPGIVFSAPDRDSGFLSP